MTGMFVRLYGYLARMKYKVSPSVVVYFAQIIFQPLLQETKGIQTILQKVENTVQRIWNWDRDEIDVGRRTATLRIPYDGIQDIANETWKKNEKCKFVSLSEGEDKAILGISKD